MFTQVERATRDGRPALVALDGPGGIGVTAAALQFYAKYKSWFPDGALQVKLSDPDRNEMVPAGEALNGTLQNLGQAPGELPATMADRSSLLRRLLSDKRVFLLLNDAVTVSQIETFLINSPGSLVVATSRAELRGLRRLGFKRVRVGPLNAAHSAALLDASAERAWDCDDQTKAHLIAVCGGYPLALNVVASLAEEPSPGRIIKRRLERGGLELFQEDEGNPVRRPLDLVYDNLPADAAEAHRMLALHPGTQFALEAAAVLFNTSLDDAEERLRVLTRKRLVHVVDEDRYEVHAPIRVHAREVLAADPELSGRTIEVVRRVATWYLKQTVAWDQVLSDRWRVSPLYQERAGLPEDVDVETRREQRARALGALEQERENLLACVRASETAGLDELTWQFCEALWGLYHLHGHFDDWIDTHQRGLAAAERLGNRLAVMHVSAQLGSAYFAIKEYSQAKECFLKSLHVAIDEGHDFGQQSAWEWLGKIYRELNEIEEALQAFVKSEEIVRRLDSQDQARALALIRLQRGRTYLKADRYAEAAEEFYGALEYFAGTSEIDNEAKARFELAQAYAGLDALEKATETGQQALALFSRDGSSRRKGEVCRLLASIGQRQGDHTTMIDYLGQAAQHYALCDPGEAEAIRQHLVELDEDASGGSHGS
ncbi:NB-ARC domain-containing protein [Saccharopolyspora phatthalungensis]|uniref:NB-ARC domain-containing protein n=1 Tax=Saccharopolyspora phatthalungensis TaxID=664693 RepID=UPI0035E44424